MRSPARWSGRTLVALLIGGLLLAALPSPALAGPVPANVDYYRTQPSQSFQSLTLPTGFFGCGSAAFNRVVVLTGEPLNPAESSTDTIVRRLETAKFSHPFPSDATVAIRIDALSLRSFGLPFTVDCDGEPDQLWSFTVGLSPAPQPMGSMTITHATNEGGTWSASLPVKPLFTFTRVGGGTAPITVDTAVGGSPIAPWTLMASGVDWTHRAPRTLITSNRFCPSCDGGPFGVFFLFSSPSAQLNVEPAFPAA